MSNFKFWIGVVVLVCASAAIAQDRPPAPPPGSTRAQPAAVRPSGPHGRSLYQAQAASAGPAVTVDPSAPVEAPRSYLEVPPAIPKTIRKHDLVTIIIREESESSSTGAASSKKEASLEAKLEEFIKLEGGKISGGGVTDPVPSIKANGSREFKGDGAVDRTDSLTFRITAEVLDVKPNGTLVLQARKRVKTDDEVQEMVMAGTCRVEDVQPDNTVLSTQLHDLDVTKKTSGSVRDATKRGWLPKLLDALNPF